MVKKNITIAIRTLEIINSFRSAGATSSSVLTPMSSFVTKLTGIPTAVIRIGYSSALGSAAKTAALITIAAQVDSAQEPNRSAPMPATSPTLSPTLSAITAGLRGSSSGMPFSTLPTRSAPTSAALVKIPPPTRANSAMVEPPRPKPAITSIRMWLLSGPNPDSRELITT